MLSLLPLGAAATVDLIAAIKENDWLGLLCLIILTAMSVCSISIIITKYITFRTVQSANKAFQRTVEEDGTWDSLFAASKKHGGSTVARLLKETYVECRVENWFDGRSELPLEARLDIAKNTIEGVVTRTITAEEDRLLSKLNALSTISTLAPLIGLFGTVWGVLAAFQAIGAEGGASISALAPGISTALMTTIFGLIAAIPAVVAYNFFMSEIRKMSSQMEAFSHDLENAVRKQIIREGNKR